MATLGVLHVAAGFFYFYWTYWWFDYMTHFIGGLSVGLMFIWLRFRLSRAEYYIPTLAQSINIGLLSVLVVGVGWELFEYYNGLTQSIENYRLDVIHDLISDLAGAVIAGIIGANQKFYLPQ